MIFSQNESIMGTFVLQLLKQPHFTTLDVFKNVLIIFWVTYEYTQILLLVLKHLSLRTLLHRQARGILMRGICTFSSHQKSINWSKQKNLKNKKIKRQREKIKSTREKK